MTYNASEASVASGAPIEGFEFIGTTETYRYTSSAKDETIAGFSFLTLPGLDRKPIVAGSQDDDGLDIEISMPEDTDLIRDYAYTSAKPDLTFTLYRVHRDDNFASDYIKAWKGEVTNFTVDGDVGYVRVPSLFSVILKENIPTKYYMGPCNHVLYDARCGVVRNSFKVTTTVTNIIDDFTFDVVDDGFVDSYLRAGECVNLTKSERRTIVDNVADQISISFPFSLVEVGDSIEMVAGCNHAYGGDCSASKFNNQANYGGIPFQPGLNPFDGEL